MPKKSDAEKEREWRDALQWVMDAPKGRLVLWKILAKSGLNLSPFRPAPPEVRPEERLTFFGARRDLGQWLSDEAKSTSRDLFDRMDLEAREREAMERMKGPETVEEKDE